MMKSVPLVESDNSNLEQGKLGFNIILVATQENQCVTTTCVRQDAGLTENLTDLAGLLLFCYETFLYVLF